VLSAIRTFIRDGIVEGFNKTRLQPSPLAIWALWEVPNATTGVSSYMLVYGRLPRGPLAVLKRDVSADLGKPVEDYMTD